MPSLALSISRIPMAEPLVAAVQEVTVETALDLAGAFSIRFGIGPSATGDWSILDSDPFRPLTQIGIRVGVGSNPIPGALINGYVTSSRVSWAEGGKSTAIDVESTSTRERGNGGTKSSTRGRTSKKTTRSARS